MKQQSVLQSALGKTNGVVSMMVTHFECMPKVPSLCCLTKCMERIISYRNCQSVDFWFVCMADAEPRLTQEGYSWESSFNERFSPFLGARRSIASSGSSINLRFNDDNDWVDVQGWYDWVACWCNWVDNDWVAVVCQGARWAAGSLQAI